MRQIHVVSGVWGVLVCFMLSACMSDSFIPLNKVPYPCPNRIQKERNCLIHLYQKCKTCLEVGAAQIENFKQNKALQKTYHPE